jgi:UDP-N-acetylglucosamine 4,6-dehydratase
MLNNKSILITGGTGSFGKRFVSKILRSKRSKELLSNENISLLES